VLLLDEPTNHLDAETVAWLENALREYPGTVIIVTHDRYFLDNVAGWILELDRGQGIPWQGNYSSWLDQKQKRLSLEEKQESARQRTLKRELEWLGMSPKAKRAVAAAINGIERYPDQFELIKAVAERCGFSVIYAAIHAIDLPEYLDNGMVTTAAMRQMTFTFYERLVLIPVELLLVLKSIAVVGVVALLLTTLFSSPATAVTPFCAYLGAVLSGIVFGPLLLPWLPGRSFAVKGAITGPLTAGISFKDETGRP
jgi:ATPase subunit of ABC transporter with duplicated ATPase domains